MNAKFTQIHAAADYIGPGAIEVPLYQTEILDIVRRRGIFGQRIKQVPATGHPSRYFEETAIPSPAATSGFVDPRNIVAPLVTPTRVERSVPLKALVAQINYNLFDMELGKQQSQFAYLRLNPRTHTSFGLGRLEVAFETVNQFLSASRYAGRLASNSVVQYALWLNEATPEQHDRLIRWWQDEIEGTGRVPLLSCEQKPEVLRFAGGTDADLRLAWQEALIRMIANAFELPPMLLGVAGDLNRNTAGELADEAFQSAVVP